MSTIGETITALQVDRDRAERDRLVADAPAGEVIKRITNGSDVAELIRTEDGTVMAVGTAVDADGRTIRHTAVVHRPKPKLSPEELRRNEVAASIAAAPNGGPRMAERYLAGEIELGPQRPVSAVPNPPRPDVEGYDAWAEDRARLAALERVHETPRRPIEEVAPIDPDARLHERANLVRDAAIDAWESML